MSSFFGTDGIRGEAIDTPMDEAAAIDVFFQQRQLHPHIFRLFGEALAMNIDLFPGHGTTVIIGWDERPANSNFAKQLTIGLRLHNCTVIHAPITSTPVLHGLVLEHDARLGCMITASHNPVSDSGVKLFDSNGMKSLPERELYLSNVMIQLSAEERPIESEDEDILGLPERIISSQESAQFHQTWLMHRISQWKQHHDDSYKMNIHRPFLIDSSKGSAHTWFASFFASFTGIQSSEVSDSANVLNDQCGAGELKPGDEWTIEEAKISSHAMIRALDYASPGTIVGGAIDGDGDRCFLLECTDNGFRVVDGDKLASMILQPRQDTEWLVAMSIESDLEFQNFVTSLNESNKTEETAVGDRWLGHSLHGKLDRCSKEFDILGVEDSGHIVMSSNTPSQRPSVVGDGLATMMRCLLFGSIQNDIKYGKKQRISIPNPHRERWSTNSELYLACQSMSIDSLQKLGYQTRSRIVEGEEDLLLIEFLNGQARGTVAIRNSGTQEKTNISLRVNRLCEMESIIGLLGALESVLRSAFS
ncbi:MAG: hypothetical protein O2866_01825 [archaeon]|nr:hypothetical protein [archaeon]MDA1167601.1 hypothetical protein [archaeon]